MFHKKQVRSPREDAEQEKKAKGTVQGMDHQHLRNEQKGGKKKQEKRLRIYNPRRKKRTGR